jgi:hypothetical protein
MHTNDDFTSLALLGSDFDARCVLLNVRGAAPKIDATVNLADVPLRLRPSRLRRRRALRVSSTFSILCGTANRSNRAGGTRNTRCTVPLKPRPLRNSLPALISAERHLMLDGHRHLQQVGRAVVLDDQRVPSFVVRVRRAIQHTVTQRRLAVGQRINCRPSRRSVTLLPLAMLQTLLSPR